MPIKEPEPVEDDFDCDQDGNKICPAHPSKCPRGMRYDDEACMCMSPFQCMMMCPKGQKLDPRKGCECVDKSVVEDLYTCEPPRVEDEFECDRRGNKICPSHPSKCPKGQRYDDEACMCMSMM